MFIKLYDSNERPVKVTPTINRDELEILDARYTDPEGGQPSDFEIEYLLTEYYDDLYVAAVSHLQERADYYEDQYE